jgi:hypothetical protein
MHDESTPGFAGVQAMGAARIGELVMAINSEHEEGEQAIADGLNRWIKCGEMLIELRREVRAEVGPRSWERWIDQESGLRFQHRQACKYVRLYRERETLIAKRESGIPVLSVQAAIDLLADPTKKKPRKPRPRSRAGHNSRGMPDAFKFEPPDLATLVRLSPINGTAGSWTMSRAGNSWRF